MKLSEFVVGKDMADEFGSFLAGMIRGNGSPHKEVRVEIHSIEPWSTERPKEWGLGWRFRVHGQKFICIHDGNAVMGVCPASGNQVSVSKDDIEAYGPRAEVGT